ncbi:MAG: peptidoglycan editing factor PgeF [Boseongicola sp.]
MTVEILTSELLAPIRHGFFTRRGGASSGVFDGLNCGTGSSDQLEIVRINRSRVAKAMLVSPEELASVHQVHSIDVVTVTDAFCDGKPKADAMVTATPGRVLTVLTADCQPVLFADAEAEIVGAAHAGWKGALNGVLEATIDAMERLGAHRDRIKAVIGPSIGQKAYEVGPEFRATFVEDDPGNAEFFVDGAGDRFHFDLTNFGVKRLQNTGIAAAAWTGHCTYSDPERFYSYRRSVHLKQADYGRLISAIRI